MSDVKKSSTYRRSTCYLLNIKQPDRTAKRLKLGFQRTYGTITILKQGRSLEAAMGFVDVSEIGTSLYTPELLHKGTQIELCIVEPFLLRVTGLVAWSVPVHTGIHGGKFKFRSGMQFIFEGEQTRLAVQEFVRKVALDPMESIKNAMAAMAAAANPPPQSEKPPEAGLAMDPVLAGVAGAVSHEVVTAPPTTPSLGDKPADPPIAALAAEVAAPSLGDKPADPPVAVEPSAVVDPPAAVPIPPPAAEAEAALVAVAEAAAPPPAAEAVPAAEAAPVPPAEENKAA